MFILLFCYWHFWFLFVNCFFHRSLLRSREGRKSRQEMIVTHDSGSQFRPGKKSAERIFFPMQQIIAA